MTDDRQRPIPSGTVTFLFTDIEGSTPLWDAHPDAMQGALARHDHLVRSAIDDAGGHVFSTGGDGFGAAFATAADAATAAVCAQRALTAEPWPEGIAISVRIGAHTGAAQERDGDYFGPPVNRAARLMGAANGGQVVVSALTAQLLGEAPGVGLVDLGSLQLKGLVEPLHVFGLDAPDHPWRDVPLVSAQPSAGNLPRPRTELVGDLAELQRRVARLADARLVTLTGSGGVGKTRAAIEIGWLVVDEFVDGVWLSELGPIADPDAVVPAVASTLGVHPQPGGSMLDSIVASCVGRRMLLIVDNCEHVLGPAADLVAAITASCPTVTVLATSREPLGIGGELVVRIPSLVEVFGVELFCDRAAAASGAFDPSPGDLDAVASIVRRLDGIPLAIELAAARTRSLSPTELLDRLDDRFRLLRGAGRGGLERHQTLRAAVMWSYDLLPERDRVLFDRLSAFAGGFDLAAAEAVCADGQPDSERDGDDVPLDALDVVDVLGELVDKSMVIAERGGAGTRYHLLETMRQFGEERLEMRGETARRRNAHLDHYAALALNAYERRWSHEQVAADAVFAAEWDNLRAAHGWALAVGDGERAARIIERAGGYGAMALRHEMAAWIGQLLESGLAMGGLEPYMYAAAGSWAFLQGDPPRGVELARRGQSFECDADARSWCLIAEFYGLASGGRLNEAGEVVPRLYAVLAEDLTAESRFHVWQAIGDATLGTAAAEEAGREYAAAAEELQGASYRARARYVEGNVKFLSADSDVDGAIIAYREAIELADASAASETATWARVTLAGALVLSAAPDAADAVVDALTYCDRVRYALAEPGALEFCVTHLMSAGDIEGASTVLGHLQLAPPAFSTLADFRRSNAEAVAAHPGVEPWLAAGAALNRRAAIKYALGRVE